MRTVASFASKVPALTAFFWAAKILTTGMGETASDWLAHRYDPRIAVLIAAIVLAASLWAQLRSPRYSAWKYWLAVAMVSVFGTMAADILHVGFGVPYVVSTAFFAASLATIFCLWYGAERTLSIHSITTRRRELFYWATVLATFALGTAAGDMAATTMRLGYFASGLLFAALITVPAAAYWGLGMKEIPAFWFAYIATRPLGASFADWAGVSHARGGLGWGTGPVSLALALLIFGLVWYLAATRPDDSGPGLG